MDKKRVKVVMKVLDDVKIKCPERARYIEEHLKKYENEKTSIEEVFYFVALLFGGSNLLDCLFFMH